MDEVSSLDWDIIPKEGYEHEWVEESIHQVKEFLKHPNKNNETFESLIRALLKDILEIDAGAIVKVFDLQSYDFNQLEPKSGAPLLKPIGQRKMTEIYIRDGASILKEIDKFGFNLGYWQYSYQIPAHPMWFNEPEIVYCIEHPRSMSCYGYSRTQAVLDIIKSLHYSTLYNKRFFEETAIPDGALSLLDTDETEFKQFMNMWNTEFKAQPHKIAFMNKDMKWQPFSMSNTELEFLETQKWYFNMVISMFGLTPAEMGITTDVNRATSATQSELVKRKGIRPFLKLLENFFNTGILPEFMFEGIEFKFIYDDPAEKKARLENWQLELNMGVKTINEVRNEMGLDPIDGGDKSNQQQNMFQMPGQQGFGNKLPNNQEDQQAPGYRDTLQREEGKNEEKKKGFIPGKFPKKESETEDEKENQDNNLFGGKKEDKDKKEFPPEKDKQDNSVTGEQEHRTEEKINDADIKEIARTIGKDSNSQSISSAIQAHLQGMGLECKLLPVNENGTEPRRKEETEPGTDTGESEQPKDGTGSSEERKPESK